MSVGRNRRWVPLFFCRQLLKAMLSMWAEDVRSIKPLKFIKNFLCILDSEVLL